MMKIKIIVCVLLAGLLFSCVANADAPDLTEIKKNLEAGQTAPKEAPFTVREFKPFLGDKWIGNAVSYGCYREGQEPGKKGPSKAEILEDLNIISKYWNLIRVYNADDDTERILEVITQHKLPIKMMMGIWLASESKIPNQKAENIKHVLRGIELANRFKDVIIAVNVGNETQVFWSWHKMDSENLRRYVRTVRSHVNVPVTVADDYNFWNKPESKSMADELDFIVTHTYSLWNGKTLDIAISWMDSTYQDICQKHPEKTVVLGETGWATTYNPNNKGPGAQGTLMKGDVSLAAQEKYLIMHNEWVNKNKVTTFYFEAFDEPWKGGGASSPPEEVEKHWGVFYESRAPKASFHNYLKHIENK